jgi:mannose-6-phosphate isomerase-like protein (cupin superfamily)
MNYNYTENRPWGSYTILLDENNCKVKKITIGVGQAPSYQYHFKRNEHWIVIRGSGTLILDDTQRELKEGDSVFIPKLSKHQFKNTGNTDLEFIEIQTGEYFGEDDIVRLQDNYGRI